MKKVLIVEDNFFLAITLEAMLRDWGYKNLEVMDCGEKAIRMAKFNDPGLILMDVGLRGAMDGIEAVEYIRRRSAVPIIFITAHSDDRTVSRLREVENAELIVKPIPESKLQRMIARHVSVA